jgi:hypothetical protein
VGILFIVLITVLLLALLLGLGATFVFPLPPVLPRPTLSPISLKSNVSLEFKVHGAAQNADLARQQLGIHLLLPPSLSLELSYSLPQVLLGREVWLKQLRRRRFMGTMLRLGELEVVE